MWLSNDVVTRRCYPMMISPAVPASGRMNPELRSQLLRKPDYTLAIQPCAVVTTLSSLGCGLPKRIVSSDPSKYGQFR